MYFNSNRTSNDIRNINKAKVLNGKVCGNMIALGHSIYREKVIFSVFQASL